MRIAVTGSHGLIGSSLVPALEASGHAVLRVVRGEALPEGAIPWAPEEGRIDGAALEGVDAVVHLAGVGIAARRWTRSHRQAVLDSRVQGTTLLARTLAQMDRPPRVLVSASAVGFYGDRDDEVLGESSPSGSGFLAWVCREWEAATRVAEDAGIRTVHLRTGIVLSARGGALKAQLPVFRLGLGGRLGRGTQWLSWIHLDDEVGAIGHVLADSAVSGPVNLVAPNPVTNADFTAGLARTLRRPAVLAVPAPALELALGPQMARELLLASQRAEPGVLISTGYRFAHLHLEEALADALGRS